MSVDDARLTKPRFAATPVMASLRQWLPLAIVIAAAVALRQLVVANTDVSWLITVAEKVLDGQVLYVDLIEVNPPASVLLYLPAVAFARFAGLRAELVIDVLVFAAACASLFFTGSIIKRARLLSDRVAWNCAVIALAVLTILPAQTFGEREHIAMMTLLPALAVFTARAMGRPVDFLSAVTAGMGAGLTMVIKPYLILAVAPLAVATAIYARSWRTLFAWENWSAGAMLLVYAAIVVIFYPTFITDTVPLLSTLYFPIRIPWPVLLARPAIPIALVGALALILFKRREVLAPRYGLPLIGAAAFLGIFLLQGKGWPYHSYPMIALVFLAIALAVVESEQGGDQSNEKAIGRSGLVLFAAVLFAGSWGWFNKLDTNGSLLVEPLRRIHPNPSMLTLTSDIALGHPLVRQLGGRWAGTLCSLWITEGAIIRRMNGPLDPATAERIAAYERRDRQILTADIERNAPDLILADAKADWRGWVGRDPALRRALAHYSTAAIIDGVEVLLRDAK